MVFKVKTQSVERQVDFLQISEVLKVKLEHID